MGRGLTRRLGVVLGAAALVALAACSGGGGTPAVSGSRSEATVKGKVTVRGKTASDGEVVFDPSNIRRPDATARRAPIAKDGTYSITTLVGTNTVSVAGPRFDRDEQVGTAQLVYEVPEGESTFDVVLPPPGP